MEIKDIMIVRYGGRTNNRGVGREVLIGQRKGGSCWLDGEIVEVKYEV